MQVDAKTSIPVLKKKSRWRAAKNDYLMQFRQIFLGTLAYNFRATALGRPS